MPNDDLGFENLQEFPSQPRASGNLLDYFRGSISNSYTSFLKRDGSDDSSKKILDERVEELKSQIRKRLLGESESTTDLSRKNINFTQDARA